MRITRTILFFLCFSFSFGLPAFDLEDYCQSLNLAVKFYGAQRCGNTHNWLLTDNPHGSRCHLEDGPAFQAGYDLSGGWHDAGDYLKFTLTTSWSAYLLLKSVELYPDTFLDQDSPCYDGLPNAIPDVLDEIKIATDYLLKVQSDANTVISRVGGEQDHDYWVTSPYQSTLPVSKGGGQRPVFADAKADVAGITAAALALMATVYSPYDTAYADSCLAAARQLYAFAQAHPGVTTDPFYQKNEWRDDMLCGAVELHRATGENDFLNQAIEWNNATASHGWVMDWSNHWDAGRHSLVKAGHTQALGNWRRDVNRYLNRVSSATYVNGLAWFGDWGSLRYAQAAAFSSALLYDVTGEEQYMDFTRSQVDYALGDNEYHRSFLIGFGENPPRNPHHANAYGREALDWNLSRPPLYALNGALVGGPTRYDTGPSLAGYHDDINDYVGNEVSIEYNAGLVGSLAAVVFYEDQSSVTPSPQSHETVPVVLSNFPNPFNAETTFSIFLPVTQRVEVVIYNIQGRQVDAVLKKTLPAGTHHIPFHANHLESGLYLCSVKSSSFHWAHKIVLTK